jgi:hypothetical protein
VKPAIRKGLIDSGPRCKYDQPHVKNSLDDVIKVCERERDDLDYARKVDERGIDNLDDVIMLLNADATTLIEPSKSLD